MKAFSIIIGLPLMLGLLTGCIKESRDDCDNVAFYFRYLADGEEDVLHQYINKVDLYVFDAQERLVGQVSYNHETLENFAAFPSFRFVPGERYILVALGNAYDHTEVTNLSVGDLDQIFVQDVHWKDPLPVTTHDHNYMGKKEFVVPEGNRVMYRDTVTLYSSHINVEVRITGTNVFPPDGEGSGLPYTLDIEHSNPQINFQNVVCGEEKGTCSPVLHYDSEKKCYRTKGLTLFRIDKQGVLAHETCGHELVLRNGLGEERIRMSVFDYLMEHPEELEKALLQEADLFVELVDNGWEIEITVPDWEIEDTTPGWEE